MDIEYVSVSYNADEKNNNSTFNNVIDVVFSIMFVLSIAVFTEIYIDILLRAK